MTINKNIEETSIEIAIESCRQTISRNRFQSSFFLTIILAIPMLAGFYFYLDSYKLNSYKAELLKISMNTTNSAKFESLTDLLGNHNSNVNLILYALLILVFGVFTSLYRFHQKEIAKYQHFLLGFMRIRIAADNSENGFNTEVRQSLTYDAFTYDTKISLLNKEKRIESPLSGHPGSDIATSLINKILDSIEIVSKKNKPLNAP